MTINMTECPDKLLQYADAAETMSIMLDYAATAFGFLARLHGDRDHEGHFGFEAVCALCERGLASVNDKEGDAVEGLVAALRKRHKKGITK